MIIAFYAGILGFIYVGLTAYVIKGRFANKLSLGDGGNEDMQKRIRAHANFMEYVPIALFLIFIAEWEGTADLLIHILALALIAGRLLHAAALLDIKTAIPEARKVGMVATIASIALASLFAFFSAF